MALRKVLIYIGIIGIFLLISTMIINKKDSDNMINNRNVIYALSLDGETINNFPEKGNYRVDVSCENAKGKWSYDEWKLDIEDIISDNITCDLDFITINEIKLNDYVASLKGMTQGTGKVVNENAYKLDYDNITILNQSQYKNINTYYNNTSDVTHVPVTGAFEFTDNQWTSIPDNMVIGNNYYMEFSVEEDGYYQVCYSITEGFMSTLNIYVNNDNYVSQGSTESNQGCQSLGHLSKDDIIKVVEYAVGLNTYPISTVTFRLERAENASEINAGIRYEGKNPNNYVWFNNELWRIIGVFDENSHGVSGQNLVKIIRNESIGSLSWNNQNINDWTTSNLKQLLNGAYLYRQNGTESGYCYGSSSITSNCDYTIIGINDTYRSMIENVTWYLGGASGEGATTEEFFEFERGTTVYSGRPLTTTGYIGLMYPSDYGYSVLSSDCERDTTLDSYSSSVLNVCAGKSWLYGQGKEWTLTHFSTNSSIVLMLGPDGSLSRTTNSYGYVIRPTLYLKSDVYVLDGDGSITDPYIIGM